MTNILVMPLDKTCPQEGVMSKCKMWSLWSFTNFEFLLKTTQWTGHFYVTYSEWIIFLVHEHEASFIQAQNLHTNSYQVSTQQFFISTFTYQNVPTHHQQY